MEELQIMSDEITVAAQIEIGTGVKQGLEDTLSAIWETLLNLASTTYALNPYTWIRPDDFTSVWARERREAWAQELAALAELLADDPLAIINAIIEEIGDKCAEYGNGYLMGYGLFQALELLLGTKGASAGLKGLKGAKLAGKAVDKFDDAGDVAKLSNKIKNAIAASRFTPDDWNTFSARAKACGIANSHAENAFSALAKGDYDKMASYLKIKPPKDKAVFWSKDKNAAKEFAESIDGVMLETTPGGKMFDDWDWVTEKFPEWNEGEYQRIEIWEALSKEYASNAEGTVYYCNPTSEPGYMWAKVELEKLEDLKREGIVTEIKYVYEGE
jgi:hypothetical protein